MALFVLICHDKAGALEQRVAARDQHLAHLRAHAAQVKLAGPFLSEAGEMNGSLIVVEADDLAAARAIAAADPFAVAGIFESVEVRPWRVTIGAIG